MGSRTQPGQIIKVTSFPNVGKYRAIFVPSGDVTVISGGKSIEFLDTEIGAINNQARYITEITSASGGVVFATK